MSAQPATPELTPPAGRIIGKNLTVVGALYAVRAVAGFVAMAWLARNLGGNLFGVYIAALSLVTIVQAVDELGGTDYLVREGTRDPSRIDSLLAQVLFLKIATTIVLFAVAVGAGAAMGFDRTELAVVALLVGREAAEAFGEALRSPLKAIERMELGTSVAIAVAVASSGALVAGAAAGWGVVGAVGLSAAVAALGIPASWAVTRRHVKVRVHVSIAHAARIARASFPFAVVEILSFATTYADTLVIRAALGRGATGLYGAATRIVFALWSIAVIFEVSTFRTLSYLAHRERDKFGAFVDRSAAGLFLAGVPFAIGGSIVGGRVLTTVFGSSFAPGTEVFRILLWSLPFAFVAVFLMAAIVADERPQDAGWIFGGAFVANVAANVVLVPRFGLPGAGWTTLGTEALLGAAATIVLIRRGLPRRWPAMALPGLVAGAIMGAVVFALRRMPLAVPVGAGAVVYAAVLTVLRVPARIGVGFRRAGSPEP